MTLFGNAVIFGARKKQPQTGSTLSGQVIIGTREEAFINQTSNYKDFDSVAKGLSDPIFKYDVLFIMTLEGSPPMRIPENQFKISLKDRRVARACQFLEKMRPEIASKKALKLFDDKLNKMLSYWEYRFDVLRGKKAFDRKISNTRLNYRAVSGALLLCGLFCEVDDVLKKIDKWSELSEKFIQTGLKDSNPKVKKMANWIARNPIQSPLLLQRQYLLNLYVLLHEINDIKMEDSLKKKVGLIPNTTRRTPFYEWDHKYEGEKIMLMVYCRTSWTDPDNERDLILSELRKSLIDH